MTEPMREGIRTSVEKIHAGEDGALTLELKPEGLLAPDTAIASSGGRGPEPMGIITWKHALLVEPFSGEWAA